MANAISCSPTCSMSSAYSRATKNALPPTVGTAKPSASVGVVGAATGSPASSAARKEAHRLGSTPITRHVGFSVLMARAEPARRPAPPQGITTKSASGNCSRISRPIVPAPATISGSSYPLIYCSPANSGSVSASNFASPILAPWITTLAPKARQRETFAKGARVGMSTVTGMPICLPCHASASAWLPADAAITPILRCSSLRHSSALRAPRSLKLPVNWRSSCFR
mmetsp:Transcript_9339/g.22111  ORF Transcript_9339/g.22111 Transcript_9339/m.22111 type:complete len:226 (+) Transcript_9339:1223-1900(+)